MKEKPKDKPRYSTLPITEKDKFKKRMPKSAVMQEYENYVKELPENEMGHFQLNKEDKTEANAIKARLLRASSSLGIKVKVIKRGDKEVVFWKLRKEGEK